MMNAVPSPSSYSNSSVDSQESSNVSMASPMSVQLSPHGLIFLQDPTTLPEGVVGTPFLRVTEEPVEKFRFRYKSEMMGTHGSILGRSSDKNRKKSYPSVELHNYNGPAIIRCSLYTAQVDVKQRTPHTHRLVVRMDNDDKDDPHEILVSHEVGYMAVFQGMGIIHTAKKNIADELVKKKRQRFLEVQKLKNINACTLSTKDEAQIRHDAEQEAKRMNLNSVTLCFEAFRTDTNGVLHPLCKAVFSKPINNMKSALTGELKICRIDKHVSSCLGGEEVFILVEKVGKKNIKIKFFEMDDEDNEIWADFGKFSELDVHHQYAIVFRTPPYRDLDIENHVEVFLQLYRPTDGDCSEPIKFTYKPSDKGVRSRKRPRSSLENTIPVMIETNTRNFVNSTSNMDTSNTNGTDRMINTNSDPILSLDIDDILQQNMKECGEDDLNSQDFKEFMKNLSLSEFNWLPPQPWNRIAAGSENGKPPFCIGSDINNKPPHNIGTEHIDLSGLHIKRDVCKPPLFNVGSEHIDRKLPSLFSVGFENLLGRVPVLNPGPEIHASNNRTYLENGYGIPFFDATQTIKMEQQINCGYTEALERIEASDLVTDGPKQKPNRKSKPPMKEIVVDTTKVKRDEIPRDEFPAIDEVTIKQEFDTKLHMCTSDLLAKNMVEKLNELLQKKPPPQELRDEVAKLFADAKSPAGDGPLHTAIRNDQKDVLKQLLTILGRIPGNQIINQRNFKTLTPLHVAVTCEQADSVKALLAVGADPNAVNSSGDTPLHLATQNTSIECVTELLDKDNYVLNNLKPQIDATNYNGWTPLHLSARMNKLDCIKALVAAGADVNKVDSTCGRTVLHLAVEESCKEIVEYLVKETKIDVNLPTYTGNTALHVACVIRGEVSASIAKLLIEYKADPHKQNNTPCRERKDSDTEGRVTVKQEPESEEENDDNDDDDDDDDDEGKLKINEDEFEEVRGQTSFDLAINNKEILDLLKQVEEQSERRSNTPELQVDVKEECDSPQPDCAVSEGNGLFDEETFKKICKHLDANKGWLNLADLLGYTFLVGNIREATSPTKLLLNYADLHGSVSVQDIRNILEALDENPAVEMIDLMLARQVTTTSGQ